MILKKSIKECPICETTFYSYASSNKTYCSHKCANTATAPKRRKRKIFYCVDIITTKLY